MPDIFISPQPASIKKTATDGLKNKKAYLVKGLNLHRQFFAAYHFMPEGVRFETQAVGESIILLLRKHWVTNILWVIISIILIILPTILFPVIFFSGIIPPIIPNSYFSFIILFWYLLTFSYILVNFLLWYFTVSIVTNERIVDIDFINVLSKKFAETRIARIEDVTNKTGGFIQALFHYGDVIVQTAAKEAMFQFESVPHPEKVVRIINDLMGKTSE